MGNLSNLYISNSFQSLIHLGDDGVATSNITLLQDGLGNSIGVGVNTAGDIFLSGSLTASLQDGYVWIGDNTGKTKTVSTSSFGTNLNTGSLLVTASFNDGTRNLTFTKGDSSQFNVNIPSTSGSATIDTGSFVTTSSFNAYTSSTNQRVSSLEVNSASVDSSINSLNVQVSLDGIAISALNNSSASQQISINNLNTNSASVNISISALNNSSASQQIQIDGLSSKTGSYATTGSNQFNGSQSVSGSVTLSGSLNNVNYIDFNTASAVPAWKSGRVFWDNTDGALAVYNREADITMQLGQEMWVRARNNTGVTIANGAAVRLIGAQGDNPLIVLAQSVQVSGSAITDNQILGIATHAIETGTDGYVTTLGNVRGLNTSAYTEGQVLFVSSSAGLLTSVVPVAPYERIPVATVVKVGSGGSGIVYVAPIPPIDFSTLSSVEISSSYTNQDVWIYEGNVWKHKNKEQIGLATTGSNTFTGLNAFQNISAVSASFGYLTTVSGSAVIIGNAFVVVNNATPTLPYGGLSVYDSGSVTPTTSSLVWDGLTNDWKYSYDVGAGHDAAVAIYGPAAASLATTTYPTANKLQKGTGGHHIVDSTIFDDGTNVSIGAPLNVTGSISSNGTPVVLTTDLASLNSFTQSTNLRLNNLESTTASLNTSVSNLNQFTASQLLLNVTYATTGSNTFVGNQTLSGSVDISGNITASLQTGYVWVGNGNGRTTTVATSSFGGAGGAAFPYTGSAQITGSLGVTGSFSGQVNTLTITSNTASLNFNDGNFFTLQLVSGSITHLTGTNVKAGQTINLLVKTDSGSASATGSLTFSSTFKFAGGFDYTPTAITASQDLVSFVTFDTTQIFAAQVKNLS